MTKKELHKQIIDLRQRVANQDSKIMNINQEIEIKRSCQSGCWLPWGAPLTHITIAEKVKETEDKVDNIIKYLGVSLVETPSKTEYKKLKGKK